MGTGARSCRELPGLNDHADVSAFDLRMQSRLFKSHAGFQRLKIRLDR